MAASVRPPPHTGSMTCHVMIWPTSPEVPMPEPTALDSMCSTTVAIGPRIAEASVGGTQMRGCRTILGTWSMDVPTPWARRPDQRFSRNEATAKPTICVAQPTVAAPAAMPDRSRMMPRAAEEIGSVRTMPMMTATMTPMSMGWRSVPQLTRPPRAAMAEEMGGPRMRPTTPPVTMVVRGVTRMSTGVRPETRRPASMAA